VAGELALALYLASRLRSSPKDRTLDQDSPIILDEIEIPISQIFRGRPAWPSLLDNRGGKRPAAVDAAKPREADPADYAAFWLVVRRGVRPSLARTVAELAGFGERPS
jgi:hypothetical protein